MFSLLQLATVVLSAVSAASSSIKVIGSDHSVDAAITSNANTPLVRTISDPNAIYVAPHFAYLRIPAGGVLTVSAPDGSQAVNYTGHHKNIYAEYIEGSSAVITYTPPAKSTSTHPAFVVDRYASGSGDSPDQESICGKDDSKAISCVKNLDATKYKKAQAVARLFIGGSGLCTGWLFGSEGHMITNNHCIGDAKAAGNVAVELGAECGTCDDPNNTKQLSCKGEVVATSAEFLHTDKTLDYTIVKLKLKDGVSLAKYGYLQARESGPALGDEIYVLQHPGGKPKRIATVLDNGKAGTIESMSIQSCSPDEVGYSLDTEGGSSGSPVLSVKENAVVALHNCGGCMNGGIKINKVVDQLKSLGLLPANALSGGDDPSPPVTSSAAPTTKAPMPTKKPSTTTKSPSPSTYQPSPSTSRPPVPTSTRPRKTCKPKTKKPTPTYTTKPSPSSQAPPADKCGTCKRCYFADVKWCVSVIDSRADCERAQGATWCGQ